MMHRRHQQRHQEQLQQQQLQHKPPVQSQQEQKEEELLIMKGSVEDDDSHGHDVSSHDILKNNNNNNKNDALASDNIHDGTNLNNNRRSSNWRRRRRKKKKMNHNKEPHEEDNKEEEEENEDGVPPRRTQRPQALLTSTETTTAPAAPLAALAPATTTRANKEEEVGGDGTGSTTEEDFYSHYDDSSSSPSFWPTRIEMESFQQHEFHLHKYQNHHHHHNQNQNQMQGFNDDDDSHTIGTFASSTTFLYNNNDNGDDHINNINNFVASSSSFEDVLHDDGDTYDSYYPSYPSSSSNHPMMIPLPPPWSLEIPPSSQEQEQAATATSRSSTKTTDFLFSTEPPYYEPTSTTTTTTTRILAESVHHYHHHYHHRYQSGGGGGGSPRTLAESSLSVTQQRALAIVPKIGSSLSMPCSCYIIYEVIQDHRRGKATAVKRALLGMSVIDVLASSAWFLSTWAVPASSGFAYAAGNFATCNFQGFLLQLAVGAPLYNSSLALFYLLMIKMRWTKTQFEKSKIEWYVHGFILTFAVGTSIMLLVLEQYNHIQAVCWVIGEPPECGNSSRTPNPDVPCERGDYAWLYGLTLFYGPIWVCVLCCTTSMFVLYNEVRKTHRRSRRYSSAVEGMRHSTNRSGQDTSRVATQAILYSLSFLVTWMPSTLWSVAHWFNWSHYGLDLFAAAAEPLQGFWNLLVFLMGRRQIPLLCRLLTSCCAKCSLYRSPESSTLDDSSGRRQHPIDDAGEQPKSRRSMESMLRSINRSSSFSARFGSIVARGSDVLDLSARQTPIAEDIDHNNNSTIQDAMAVATELVALEDDELHDDANTNSNANAADGCEDGVSEEDKSKNDTADESRSAGTPNPI